MKILLIKMSSLGDLLHTMPAVTDACSSLEGLHIDWLCEEPFADIARLHPQVNIIPHGRLRWKKKRLAWSTIKEQWQFYHWLRKQDYDLVIDAQGRIKSARVGWLSGSPVCGPSRDSATDEETHWFYRRSVDTRVVSNAVDKTRVLFSDALGYKFSGSADFGIDPERLAPCVDTMRDQVVFLHGTTWASKHWPESEWIRLMGFAREAGIGVLLPWANDEERERAERIIAASHWGQMLPKMALWELCGIIGRSLGAVGVDTGLMHVAAAMEVPTVSVFGSTSVTLTGAMGKHVINLQADYSCSPCRKKICSEAVEGTPPCYKTLPAGKVWDSLLHLIEEKSE